MGSRLHKRMASLRIKPLPAEALARMEWSDRVKTVLRVAKRIIPAPATQALTQLLKDHAQTMEDIAFEKESEREKEEAFFREAFARDLVATIKTKINASAPITAEKFVRQSAASDILNFVHWLLDVLEANREAGIPDANTTTNRRNNSAGSQSGDTRRNMRHDEAVLPTPPSLADPRIRAARKPQWNSDFSSSELGVHVGDHITARDVLPAPRHERSQPSRPGSSRHAPRRVSHSVHPPSQQSAGSRPATRRRRSRAENSSDNGDDDPSSRPASRFSSTRPWCPPSESIAPTSSGRGSIGRQLSSSRDQKRHADSGDRVARSQTGYEGKGKKSKRNSETLPASPLAQFRPPKRCKTCEVQARRVRLLRSQNYNLQRQVLRLERLAVSKATALLDLENFASLIADEVNKCAWPEARGNNKNGASAKKKGPESVAEEQRRHASFADGKTLQSDPLQSQLQSTSTSISASTSLYPDSDNDRQLTVKEAQSLKSLIDQFLKKAAALKRIPITNNVEETEEACHQSSRYPATSSTTPQLTVAARKQSEAAIDYIHLPWQTVTAQQKDGSTASLLPARRQTTSSASTIGRSRAAEKTSNGSARKPRKASVKPANERGNASLMLRSDGEATDSWFLASSNGGMPSVIETCTGSFSHLNIQHIAKLETNLVATHDLLARSLGVLSAVCGSVGSENDSLLYETVQQLAYSSRDLAALAILLPTAPPPRLPALSQQCEAALLDEFGNGHPRWQSVVDTPSLYQAGVVIPMKPLELSTNPVLDSALAKVASAWQQRCDSGEEPFSAAKAFPSERALLADRYGITHPFEIEPICVPTLEHWIRATSSMQKGEYREFVGNFLASVAVHCRRATLLSSSVAAANSILSKAIDAYETVSRDAVEDMAASVKSLLVMIRRDIALPLKDLLQITADSTDDGSDGRESTLQEHHHQQHQHQHRQASEAALSALEDMFRVITAQDKTTGQKVATLQQQVDETLAASEEVLCSLNKFQLMALFSEKN